MKLSTKKNLRICLVISLSIILIAIFVLCMRAYIEQRIYITKMLPVLREISTPNDKRLEAASQPYQTDSWGFGSYFSKTKLTDGWVIILDRSYPEDSAEFPVLRQFFEHRVVIFKDSTGRIYVRAQGILPASGINDDKEEDWNYEPAENMSVNDFFRKEKNLSSLVWNVWEINN